MEEPKTTWTEKDVLTAAEGASCLSTLLRNEGLFKSGALTCLSAEHIAKFLDAMDQEEATKLLSFARGWHYVSDPTASMALPLLAELNRCRDGWRLIARIATHQPAWVTRWCKYNNKIGLRHGDDLLTQVLVCALTAGEFQRHASELTDDVLTLIIRRRPDLAEVVPRERLGPILSLAVEEDRRKSNYSGGHHHDAGNTAVVNLPEVLSAHGLPSDATAIINGILDSGEKSDLLSLLDELVTRWKGPPASDPVTRTMREGHEQLDDILRSPWRSLGQPFEKRDDKFWSDSIGWKGVGHAIASAAAAVPGHFRLELGFSVGVRIANDSQEPTSMEVSERLNKLGIDPSEALVGAIFPMTELWATLRTLAKYEKNSWEHKTELIGLRAKVASRAADSPSLWAQALPWILVRVSALGNTAQAVTLELASTTQEVRGALESACNDKAESVRLMACGMQALLHGLENPELGLARTLADAAAHYIDGTPIFPHPLAPMSATWLGAAGVERAIANGVRRATDRFASEVRDQGGDIEEALTKALVKEIEVEFRGIQPRLKVMGASASRLPVPILSVRQRPSCKQTEEPVYGCDLAWLLNATVWGRYSATWVDLIQVKKSKTLQHNSRARPRVDSWQIDCKQLNNLLKWSATAAYWLIASAGEVLVIPARHLEGIRRGTEKHVNSKTFTAGYHEVRSAAIPLEHYLGDLLIGQWVGTSSEEVVQFALGENSTIRPRLVVEVTISVGHDNQ